ncbi:uncharacterized protein L969DRAFT_95772 [Mixia osmundae IAM 14324]|uniref:Dynactin subunit 2 n=1 Tax=Mixia osmundae (strain CBS 9802 / IAM 14324 / JCM 22182 / KY 12970) TaxID=764103 RepID=G7DSM2_MIXOS|nr:uncharacterized protein L969DRAFT_95772 [Mixia osmundae IAM 14324]KEI37922.1 hypothetical protein L969DRAFT_95772 [Mixia osmundae IAM 14324]GAA93582.1 hypothetical protein E5Q_00226 [Mixia osmundae IAM 14324]
MSVDLPGPAEPGMSKYNDLPDIDNAPEVYETAEPATVVARDNDSDDETEAAPEPQPGLETTRLDVTSARTKFHSARLNGSAPVRGLKGTRRVLPDSEQYEIRLPNHGSDEASTSETPLQRLRRLRMEVAELEDDLAATTKKDVKGKGPEITPALMLSQLKLLKSDLTQIAGTAEQTEAAPVANGTQLMIDTIGSSLPVASASIVAPRASAQLSDDELAAHLDERLNKLERVIGAQQVNLDNSDKMPPPLVVSLNKINHQLQLISQPRHLDTVSRRIRSLVSDLERLHDTRRKLGDTRPINLALSGFTVISPGNPSAGTVANLTVGSNTDLPVDTVKKIDELYDLLPRIEPLLPLVPHLLDRLRSLARLHTSAATFAAELQTAKEEVARLAESDGSIKEILTNLETSSKANEERIKANMALIEKRIAALS